MEYFITNNNCFWTAKLYLCWIDTNNNDIMNYWVSKVANAKSKKYAILTMSEEIAN